MFAALVLSRQDVMPLAATLSALVEGAAAGLIGHAVIIAPAGPHSAAIAELAEATGADLIDSSYGDANQYADTEWHRAASIARGDWLLLIGAGEVPGQGWIQEVERHALTARGRPGFIARAGWQGWRERMALALPGATAPRAGHIVPKRLLLPGGGALPESRVLAVRRGVEVSARS